MAHSCDPVYPTYPAHAQGVYHAHAVQVLMSEAVIDGLLPAGLERAPLEQESPGQHPVTLLFGRHEHVRPDFIPFGGLDYEEFIFAIPFVQWEDERMAYRGPFAFMPRMYLDELLPTLLGYMYAFPKEVARIQGGEHYQIHSLLLDRRIITSDFAPHGPRLAPAEFEHFGAARALFEQPFVGKLDVGPFVCSHMNFHLEQCVVQACEAAVEIEHEFLPGVIPQLILSSGLDVSPAGAFTITSPWTLTLPFPAASIRCAGA